MKYDVIDSPAIASILLMMRRMSLTVRHLFCTTTLTAITEDDVGNLVSW